MVDRLIKVTDEDDTTPKNIRLKAISGDPDSAHAVAVSVDGGVSLSATDNAVLDVISANTSALSPISAVAFDTILITYTGADKGTISKVEYKLGGVVVKTLTPTFAALTDTWVRS
jgi:hypothetical protein